MCVCVCVCVCMCFKVLSDAYVMQHTKLFRNFNSGRPHAAQQKNIGNDLGRKRICLSVKLQSGRPSI